MFHHCTGNPWTLVQAKLACASACRFKLLHQPSEELPHRISQRDWSTAAATNTKDHERPISKTIAPPFPVARAYLVLDTYALSTLIYQGWFVHGGLREKCLREQSALIYASCSTSRYVSKRIPRTQNRRDGTCPIPQTSTDWGQPHMVMSR